MVRAASALLKGGNYGGGDVMDVDRAVRGSSHNVSLRKDLDCAFGLRFCGPPGHRASVHSACGDEAIPPSEMESGMPGQGITDEHNDKGCNRYGNSAIDRLP